MIYLHLLLIALAIRTGTASPLPIEEILYPEESAGLFEGDIDEIGSVEELRAATMNEKRKWPNGIIHYTIEESQYTPKQLAKIEAAIADFHKHTCLKFRKRTTETAYIRVMKKNGCSSALGRTGRAQTISLANGCIVNGIIIHEFMHALGFMHEQGRPDRDDYITVHFDNIKEGRKPNFNKAKPGTVITDGISYDYGSLMHYGRKAFAIDRTKDTITPKIAGVTVGQRKGMSAKDVNRINKFYKCPMQ